MHLLMSIVTKIVNVETPNTGMEDVKAERQELMMS